MPKIHKAMLKILGNSSKKPTLKKIKTSPSTRPKSFEAIPNLGSDLYLGRIRVGVGKVGAFVVRGGGSSSDSGTSLVTQVSSFVLARAS